MDNSNYNIPLSNKVVILFPIYFLIFIELFSLGMVLPILPIVTTEYFARKLNGGVLIDCVKEVESKACQNGSLEANFWSSISTSCGSLALFFISPLLGQVSDKYGRKPFLVLSQILHLIYPFSILLFTVYDSTIIIYYIASFILTAYSSLSVAIACIADVVASESRASAFGLILSVSSSGFVISASLAATLSYQQIYSFIVLCYSIRVMWAYLMLYETLPPSKRIQSIQANFNPIKSMDIIFRNKLFRRLSLLVIITALVSSGTQSFIYYFLNNKLSFDSLMNSHLMVINGISSILVLGILLKPLADCFDNRGLLIIAIFSSILTYISYILAWSMQKNWIVFTMAAFSGFGDLSFPAIASLKSIYCSEKEQGQIQGAIYGIRGLSTAIGPLLFSFLYENSQHLGAFWEKLPFLISIGVLILSLGVAKKIPRRSTLSRLFNSVLNEKEEYNSMDQKLLNNEDEQTVL